MQAISAPAVHSGNMASGGEARGFAAAQSPVLRIIVENLFYPVTLEVLQQVARQPLISIITVVVVVVVVVVVSLSVSLVQFPSIKQRRAGLHGM